MAEVIQALGITKDVWDKIPEEYQQKITKAVIDRQIDLAKQMLAKILGKGNPAPQFNPVEKAVADAWNVDFFGGKHWSPEKFSNICRMRGLVGAEIWNHKALSAPLKLFVQATKDTEEEKLNALLHNFAVALALEENAVRRHFYAIRLGYEDVFLVHIAEQEKKRKKLEELVEEAESEAPEKEETEEKESEEE